MNRIKELRQTKGITQEDLGKILNVQKSAVSKYEKGSVPLNSDTIEKLASYFKVSTDYVLGVPPLAKGLFGDGFPSTRIKEENKKQKGVRIPVLGTIVAGIPVSAVEAILAWEEIPECMARSGEYFGLRVKGRSMEPNFIEGDTVIVRKQSGIDSGRVAVVLIDKEEATLKKVSKSQEGITLIGYNSIAYEPHFYSNKEIEELPVQIIGEVVELRRKI